MSILKSVAGAIISPVTKAIETHQVNKTKRQELDTKIKVAKLEGNERLELTRNEIDMVRVQNMASTWTDEYVIVSLFSIVNMTIFGGIAYAMGYPLFLEGIAKGVGSLVLAGVNVGNLITVAAYSALGITVYRRVF